MGERHEIGQFDIECIGISHYSDICFKCFVLLYLQILLQLLAQFEFNCELSNMNCKLNSSLLCPSRALYSTTLLHYYFTQLLQNSLDTRPICVI